MRWLFSYARASPEIGRAEANGVSASDRPFEGESADPQAQNQQGQWGSIASGRSSVSRSGSLLVGRRPGLSRGAAD